MSCIRGMLIFDRRNSEIPLETRRMGDAGAARRRGVDILAIDLPFSFIFMHFKLSL